MRVLATVALAGSVAIATVAIRPDDSAAAATNSDGRRLATPVWSSRRVPALFVDTVARHRLATAAAAIAANHDACLAIDDADPTNGVLARARADVALVPASTNKLLTSAAALTVLGGDFTFTTRALLAGDTLYLVGAGDPVLSTPAYEQRLRDTPRTRTDVVTPLAALADAITAFGVRDIETIVADDSHHDDVRFLPGWKESYRTEIGALSALAVDDGTSGGVRVEDPALAAAQQLATLLTARGATVGGTSRGDAPDGAQEVGHVTSPPLADIVASMLTSSDNFTAELLLRELGGDGTTGTGTQRVVATLTDLGVPTAGLDLRDGSGLHPENRVTCDAILGVLQLGLEPIDRGLAVAGETGTLVNRLGGDPLQGSLRAKTGQIAGVASFAGVVDDADALRFAYIVNGDFSTSGGQSLQVDAARLVAAYPDAPAAGDLVPLP
jgi:D-alanyl-D-alanine carboxypeptidase/D-alanyl-D-alanine-endopeptidase (penicillin-binding protein 4)